MAPLQVAIIGYGAVAGVHARVIREASDVDLAAVIGPNLEKANCFAAEHGGAPAFGDLDTAIGTVVIGAVIIASPTDLHFVHALAAVSANLHVLVEFPLHVSASQACELLQLARRTGRVLAVAHTSRFLGGMVRVKELIDAESLGRCKMVSFVRLINRPPRTGADGTPRSWDDDVLVHHAAHFLDRCLYWFGSRFSLVDVVAPSGPSGRRNCALLLRGPDAMTISAALTYDAFCESQHLVLTMERGVIEIDGFARMRVNGVEETVGRPASEEDVYHDTYVRHDTAFFAAASGRHPFVVSPEESIVLSDLITKAVKCAARHE